MKKLFDKMQENEKSQLPKQKYVLILLLLDKYNKR